MEHAVLIVDDEPKIFQALRRALHREPYELLFAESGDTALQMLGDRSVDVIIADQNMPGMKGSALLARCKQQWPDMVRMMLTGDARLETVVAAVNRGEIYRFFIKPCNEAELIISIRDALQLRQLKAAAGVLLHTVKKQNETIQSMSARDGSVTEAEPPPIVLAARPKTPVHAPGGATPSRGDARGASVPGGRTGGGTGGGASDNSGRGGTFMLTSKDIPEDVDKLLADIRSELEKLEGL